jgi:acetyltransferase-like isoleucine patch superfamily enzyme
MTSGDAARLVAARVRAGLLRIRGATIGSRTKVAGRVTVPRPRGLSCGTRCEIEHDVFLKLATSEARLTLGDYVFLGRGCEIDVALSVSIGDHSLLAPNVFVTDHSHNIGRESTIAAQGVTSRGVTIGRDVWIGTGSVILAGVTIGDGAVIGANSVVNADVPPYAIMVGAPARFVRERS